MDVFKSYSSDEEKEDEVELPGFRFHPTEEELLEFYVPRKPVKINFDPVRWAFDKELLENGWESLNKNMYGFFKNGFYRDKVRTDLGWSSLYVDHFGSQASADVLEMLDDFHSLKYSKFEALMSSSDFMFSTFSLYRRYRWMEDEVFLETSDGGEYKIRKKAVIAESKVLRDVVKRTGNASKIPVCISGDVFSKAIDFMNMEFSFREQLERHKESIGDFLNNNLDILPDLYQVGEYLKIPSLLNLTSLVSCRIRSMADGIWDSKNDFSKFFKSFQNGYKDCVKGFNNAKNVVVSDLYQAANLADISSFLGSTSHLVECMTRRTLDDILGCYAKLTFA